MELNGLKPSDAKTKLEELNAVEEASRTDEQKTDITQLDTYVTEFDEYKGLAEKDEGTMSEDEGNRVLELVETYGEFVGEETITPKPDGSAGTDKKYAGIYDSVEDLINGISNSETERKRVIESLSEVDKKAMEDYYKTSQRGVTKAVELSKGKGKAPEVTKPVETALEDFSKIPLNQRRMSQVTEVEFGKWQKEKPMEASSWLTKQMTLNESQETSRVNLFKKYPLWMAEMQGVLPISKELAEFERIRVDREAEFLGMSNGPEACMVEMETSLGIGKAPEKKIAKKPETPPIKPSNFVGGKGSKAPASGNANRKLTADEYEALSDPEKDAYDSESVGLG